MDSIDKRLVRALQIDGRKRTEDLAQHLNVSASQVSRRRTSLETAKYIKGYSARIDARKCGLTVQAFVYVEMAIHDPSAANEITSQLLALPQVVEAWTLTGDADYLLQVYCEDLADLNRLVHEKLLPLKFVAKVRSQVVLNHLKDDGPLPL